MEGSRNRIRPSRRGGSETPSGNRGIFSSNAVRLSLEDWGAVAAVVALTLALIGRAWRLVEPFEPGPDYRMSYELSEDYWLFDRFCTRATQEGETLVLGDSFVWGQYVEANETLTHFLDLQAGEARFVNLGLDGAHPLAMEGLTRHYCGGLHQEEILLHLNLLWMSSPQTDLQTERVARLNHPRLIPQLHPWIPAYGASWSERIGIVVDRYVPAFDWARHLQIAYLGHSDLSRWTLDHPYRNPLKEVTFRVPGPATARSPNAEPWSARGGAPQDPPWVELSESLQWKAVQRTVLELRARGNRVSVLVGPINEHMLTPSSAGVHRELVADALAWLGEEGIPSLAPTPLPSELYADLSHPLGDGYRLLAEELWRVMFRSTPFSGPPQGPPGQLAGPGGSWPGEPPPGDRRPPRRRSRGPRG